ncbi:E3 ubiquitin-protein ligase IPI1 [Linum perenne]
MQCPNCRKIEKGQWLYANGCRSVPEINMDDWTHDEDVYYSVSEVVSTTSLTIYQVYAIQNCS